MKHTWRKGGTVGLTLVLATLSGTATAQEAATRTPVPAGQPVEKRLRPDNPTEVIPLDPALVDRLYAEYCRDEEQRENAKATTAGKPDAPDELSEILRRLNPLADPANPDAALLPSWDKDVRQRPARHRLFDLHLGGALQLDYSDTEQAYELRRR
jgi:hypothetical protein